MTSVPPAALRRRGLGARLVPFVIALGALPLMAPTCGSPGEGYKIFSKQSLIIPMDVCYQYQTDAIASSYTPVACPQTKDPGSVIKAYGLVYELIRAGVPVYWIIQTGKPSVTAIDLTIDYEGGVPAFLYNWTNGTSGAQATANHTIDYRGGPFVVDGSDYAKASAVLQQFKATFSTVNVHVANVSFRGYVKRTMAGGWSAGGTVPPKLALLDIGSSGAGSKNSEYVIQGYLAQAGLDTANAGGTTAGPHGQIYDHLYMPDFIPAPGGDWTTTKLYQNGYQILWVPHWAAPSSCSDCPPGPSCTCSNKYDPVTITSALKTIGQFSAAGGDVFAECAGLGSFEGVFQTNGSTGSYSSTYGSGGATTHFQTTSPTGVWINKSVGNVTLDGFFDSPFMQIGDWPFKAATGAIQNYKPAAYKSSAPEVTTKLISDASDSTYDIFTLIPRTGAHGTVVYLGGHSYSGNDGSFEVAGTRLVLNTLFNLGASCTATGLPCNTGLLGVCSQGVWSCDSNGMPFCQQTVFPSAEICDGLDNNCNGAVDEGLTASCYDPPAGYVDPLGRTGAAFTSTQNVGVCQPGVSSCARNPDGSFGMSACVGQVLPSPETCNGLDDDCNGTVDDNVPARACYDGPQYTLDASGNPMGICKPGSQWCQNGVWGSPQGAGFTPGVCQGEVLPQPEVCPADPSSATTALDLNCDGTLLTGCTCTNGTQRSCFTGAGTPGVGICQAGTQQCQSGAWTPCEGVVNADPNPEACVPASMTDPVALKAADTNCDGRTTPCLDCAYNANASLNEWQSCYGPDPGVIPANAGRGQCTWGRRDCTSAGKWGECKNYGFASTIEYCDNRDNNCNGPRVASPDGAVPAAPALTALGSPAGVDDDAVCPVGDKCILGVCVPATCGTERPAPEGYACSGGQVVLGSCGAQPSGCSGADAGKVCQFGTCIGPCDNVACASGAVCGGGSCIGGGCYETGCPSGQLCLGGACAADPCAGLTCPSGTFCRQGDCVQACTFVTCAAGQKCGIDGFCVNDPCAGKTCGAGQRCVSGACVDDPCAGLACAGRIFDGPLLTSGQVCDSTGGTAVCVDDPCTGVDCPAGVCIRGQCFATGNLTGAGTARETSSKSGGCGCGSGSGAALPALLALLAVPLARRRRGPGGAGVPGGRAGLLLALLSVALVASACKQSKTASQFDPSGCAATCSEQRCVDVTSDPSHCGGCSVVCAAGQQCVDSVCGPTTAVAPFISSVSPSTGAKDDPSLTLTLSGQRFQAGATVRMSTALGPRTETCPAGTSGTCFVNSAGQIVVDVDLTGIPAGSPFALRVVNPDKVISNAVGLTINIPIPAIAGVTPTSVVAGTTVPLEVSPTGSPGTGFTAGSQCHLKGPIIGNIGLPTVLAPAPSNDLRCTLDTTAGTGVPPGSYQLTVVSETSVESNAVAVTVSPSDPVVFSVVPDAAAASSIVALTVTGARFDASSKILFNGAAIPSTTFLDSGHLTVAGYQVPATAGLYGVAVQNGAGTPSNAVTFTVGSVVQPVVTSFAPPTAFQGDPSVQLTFTGSGLPSGSAIEVQPPGSSTYAAVASGSTTSGCSGSPSTCTQVTTAAPHLSLVPPAGGSYEGTWNVRVRLGGTGSTLPPWQLRVLSNQAILRSYSASPAPAQSGQVGETKTSVTFGVSNLQGWTAAGVPDLSGVRVAFFDPAFPNTVIHSLTPSPTPAPGATSFTTGSLSLAGLKAGLYAFTVNNPNATASNALTFAVNPGPPTLTSVCVTGAPGCTTVQRQQDAAVSVTLTGTNFAAPDQYGNNGSVVMVASAYSPNFPALDPCNASTSGTTFQQVTGTLNVQSATQMTFSFDSRQAFVDPGYGTTYYVSIWNPPASGGATQKSDCQPNVVPVGDPTKLPYVRLTP